MMRIFFVLSMMIFLLTGCGGKPTASKMKISTSFAATNGSFPGGMMIVGRSSDGKVFSKGVGFTGGTNTLDVSLPNGQWTFSVIGWTVAAVTNAVCDTTTKLLDGSDATIDLTPTQANCSQAIYGQPIFYGADFQPLNVGGCGTLFTDNTGTPISAGTSALAWCNGSLSSDLKGKKVLSIKATLMNVDVNGALSESSIFTCRSSANVSNNATTLDINIPTKQVPVKLEFFAEDLCVTNSPKDMLGSYFFRDGIDSSYSFDYKFQLYSTNQPHLFLPTSRTQRGYSPFLNILPKITCNGGTCLPSAMLVSGPEDRVISQGSPFVYTSAPGINCSSLGTVSINSTPLTTNQYRCDDKDGVVMLALFSIPPACSSNCPLTTGAGPTYDLTVKLNDDSVPHFYDSIYELIGTSLVANNPSLLSSGAFSGKDDKAFGLISEARKALIPNGPGGLFGQSIPCTTYTGIKTITIFDEDGFKNYQVEIANDSTPVPNYICVDTDPNASTCAVPTFEKKLIARRIVPGPAFITEQVMHFFCSRKVGMVESQQNNTDSGDNRFERQLLSWNSEIPNRTRVDRTTEEKTFVGTTGTVRRWETKYDRFEKNDISESLFFTAKSMSYRAELDQPANLYYRETVTQSDFNMKNGFLTTSEKTADLTNTVSFARTILSDPFYKEPVDSYSSTPYYATAVNSFGDRVSAWSFWNGSYYSLKLAVKYATDSNPSITTIAAMSSFPIKPRVAFNDVATTTLRFPVVVFESDAIGSTSQNYMLRFDPTGPGWVDRTGIAFSTGININTSGHTGRVSDVFFPTPTAPDFVVVTGSTFSANRFIEAHPYYAGSWGSAITILSGPTAFGPLTDIRVIKGADGIYIAGNSYYGGTNSHTLDTQFCDAIFLLTGTGGTCGTGAMGSNSITNTMPDPYFNLYPLPGTGAGISRTFGMNPQVVTVDNNGVQSGLSSPSNQNLMATRTTCFDSSSNFGTPSVPLSTADCGAQLDQTLVQSISQTGTYYMNPRKLDPTSTAFTNHFLPAASFLAQ